MIRERILTTMPTGRVAITCPAECAIAYLMHGATGDWHPWFGRPWWFWMVQFSRMVDPVSFIPVGGAVWF